MSLLKEIEQKIEFATKQLTDNQALLNQKTQHIEQLSSDKNTIVALIHQLNGYLTFAHDIKSKLEPVIAVAEAIDPAITPVVAAVDAVGTVVEGAVKLASSTK